MKHIKAFEGIDPEELEKSRTYLSKPISGVKPSEDKEFVNIPQETSEINWQELEVIPYTRTYQFTIKFPDHIQESIGDVIHVINVNLNLLDLDRNLAGSEYQNLNYIKKEIKRVYTRPEFKGQAVFNAVMEAYLNYFQSKWETVREFKNQIKNQKWQDLFFIDYTDDFGAYNDAYITFNNRFFPILTKISHDWNMIGKNNRYLGKGHSNIDFSMDFVFRMQVDSFNFNRTHFQDGLINFLKGLGIGFKLYMALVHKVGFISTRDDASNSAMNLWRKLITSNELIGLVFNTQEEYKFDFGDDDDDDDEDGDFYYDDGTENPTGYAIVFAKTMDKEAVRKKAYEFVAEFRHDKEKIAMDNELKSIIFKK